MDGLSVIFSAICGILTTLGLVNAAKTLNVVFGFIDIIMLVFLVNIVFKEYSKKKS